MRNDHKLGKSLAQLKYFSRCWSRNEQNKLKKLQKIMFCQKETRLSKLKLMFIFIFSLHKIFQFLKRQETSLQIIHEFLFFNFNLASKQSRMFNLGEKDVISDKESRFFRKNKIFCIFKKIKRSQTCKNLLHASLDVLSYFSI